MRQKPGTRKSHEKVVKDICRATHKQYSAEEKIRIVLDGREGEDSIAELCHRELTTRVIGVVKRSLSSKQRKRRFNSSVVGRRSRSAPLPIRPRRLSATRVRS
ncbi:MAG: hypothetical protein AAFV69_15975, partial [Pseudomonadota bacterium]